MRFSIITINYNNLEGFKATYESIISQRYRDWEWIVIDGGSTEGDRDFIEQHQSEMSYWCSEPDRGVYHAMNKGILQAKGDYLIFMNSGDSFYDDEVLAKVATQEHRADVLYGDWVRIYEDGRRMEIKAPDFFSLHFICTDNVCHQAMFIRNEVMKTSPYDETYRFYADWAKWIELTLRKCTFEHIPFNVCNYMMGGLSDGFEGAKQELALVQEKELSPAIRATLALIGPYQHYRLAVESTRLINKSKLFKKIIHCAIRLCHLLESSDNQRME